MIPRACVPRKVARRQPISSSFCPRFFCLSFRPSDFVWFVPCHLRKRAWSLSSRLPPGHDARQPLLSARGRFIRGFISKFFPRDAARAVHDLWKKIQFVRKNARPGLQEFVVLFILPDRGDSLR